MTFTSGESLTHLQALNSFPSRCPREYTVTAQHVANCKAPTRARR